nr:type 4b pilus protein PilO2 [Xanthomonas euvesicatoria]
MAEVHGKRLAGGLLWVPLESLRHYKREAREEGKKRQKDMVAIRKSPKRIQAGFAPKTKKRVKGIYSLASVLASQLGENWLAVFQTGPDEFAMVAVIDNQILPGRDRMGGRQEIEALMHETWSAMKGQVQPDPVIAPTDWNFSSDTRTLAEVIGPKDFKKEHELRPLAFGLTGGEVVQIAAGAAVLGSIAFATNIYLEKKKAIAAEEAAIAAANAEQLKAIESKREPARPWVSLPAVNTLLDACAQHMSTTPLSIGGWVLGNIKCAPGRATALYNRGDHGAPLAAFVAAASSQGKPPNIHQTGISGTTNARLELAGDDSDTLVPMGQAVIDLTNYVQAFGQGASFDVSVVEPKPDADASANKPTWHTSQFTIKTQFPPERLLQGAPLTGVRVMEVDTDLDTDTAELSWTLTGEIYGR